MDDTEFFNALTFRVGDRARVVYADGAVGYIDVVTAGPLSLATFVDGGHGAVVSIASPDGRIVVREPPAPPAPRLARARAASANDPEPPPDAA